MCAFRGKCIFKLKLANVQLKGFKLKKDGQSFQMINIHLFCDYYLPAKFPDLTPLDFFLRRYINEPVTTFNSLSSWYNSNLLIFSYPLLNQVPNNFQFSSG